LPGFGNIYLGLGIVLMGYLIGSIPMGYLVIKTFAKKDITKIGSGRTGGTNALRAGGAKLGIVTGVLDFFKGFAVVAVLRRFMPEETWLQVLAGVATVVGHNWSIWLFLLAKRFNAGVGTAPNIGAAAAFWIPIVPIVVPIVGFFIFVIGYGSLASIAAALAIAIILFLRVSNAGVPLQYGVYGLITFAIVLATLQPNIKRLLEGTERRVGIFAKKSA
jgi:glycerol-3-phosphate acyltransferase PlsY